MYSSKSVHLFSPLRYFKADNEGLQNDCNIMLSMLVLYGVSTHSVHVVCLWSAQ